MKIIFQIDGGLGKSIAATAVCKAIKVQYPNDKLIVVTGYPHVFTCNPYVDKALAFNNLNYFYEENIDGQQIKMMVHNPYLETDFITLNGHLIKVWCEMFGIRYNGEQPELFINNREQNFYANQFGQSQKPILLIQTNGGAENQQNKYSWTRDLPIGIAQPIVNYFANEYNVLHIRRKDQLPLQNTTPVEADFRALAVLIQLSHKRLFIDSFAQHAAAALGKPSVVCWVGNQPSQFGYEVHTNIMANKPTLRPELRNSVYSRYNISGQPTEFPYRTEAEIFNVGDIIAAIKGDVEQPQKSPHTENIIIRDNVVTETQKGSMVANRLAHLAGVADLSNVKQVLDIGSCHLDQSIEFARVFNKAKIDAFEPVPDSFQLCASKLDALPQQMKQRIQVHNLALSNAGGELPFYPVDPERSSVPNVGASSMFRFKDGLNGTPFGQNLVQREITVQADTLDNWCARNSVDHVDIMWLDVQGAELLVMQGADNTLKNTRIIMTEVGLKPYYEGHTLKPAIDEYLTQRGFRELKKSFQLNGFDYEANTIYIKN